MKSKKFLFHILNCEDLFLMKILIETSIYKWKILLFSVFTIGTWLKSPEKQLRVVYSLHIAC